MNHQVSLKRTERIAEYFVVISCDSEFSQLDEFEEFGINTRFCAIIHDRYPIIDRNESRLPAGIEYFCFPDGLHLYEEFKKPTFHSFVHTSEDGSHMLGCCLTFCEEVTGEQRMVLNSIAMKHDIGKFSDKPIFVSKCLCLISCWPFVTSFKKFLLGLYSISKSISQIPLERYICNIIDDVPAPPAGKVDIVYYLADTEILFRCPPINEPNVWSGLPLFPLFECLSPENVMFLFALVLTERQLLFVSSQYSLLTCCAEAIISLIYPLTWSHAYIPIVPVQLLGVLGAPFPFILGLHTCNYSVGLISENTVHVLLDENKILFGAQGPPPPIQDRRYRKLLQHIRSVAPVFEQRVPKPLSTGLSYSANPASVAAANAYQEWVVNRLSNFDDAFSNVSDKAPLVAGTAIQAVSSSHGDHTSSGINESLLREGFLKFFVNLLKNYKKYLIYGNADNPDPLVKFRFQEFLAEHPADGQEFVKQMIGTQAFSQFVDERVLLFKQDQDVIFFDESIDAKMNRYTFRFRNIDTPFLTDNTSKHIKTYVPPSPDLANVTKPVLTAELQRRFKVSEGFHYEVFPRLNPLLFVAPRKLNAQFDRLSIAIANQPRLKKKHNAPSSHSPAALPPIACAYSCFIVIVSQFICSEMNRITASFSKPVASTQQIIGAYGNQSAIGQEYIMRRRDSNPVKYLPPLPEKSLSSATLNSNVTASVKVGSELSNMQPICTAEGNDNDSDLEGTRIGLSPVEINGHSTPKSSTTTEGDQREGLHFAVESAVFGMQERSDTLTSALELDGPEEEALPIASKLEASDLRPKRSIYAEENLDVVCAAKLALKVAFEALNCLSKHDLAPDEITYRCLADACGACGDFSRAVDLLVYMDDEGLLPDHQMLHAVVRALASDNERSRARSPTKCDTDLGATKTTQSTSAHGPQLKKPPRISPAEVWNFHDWRSLQKSESTLFMRKAAHSQPAPPLHKKEDSLTGFLFGATAGVAASAASAVLSAPEHLMNQLHTQQVSSPRERTIVRGEHRIAIDERIPWDTAEGQLAPKLQWSNFKAPDRVPIFVASKKLNRHMIICEKLLDKTFPGLRIVLESEFGTVCPNAKCTVRRPLSVSELYQGWKESAGDSNKYTTRCKFCGTMFIPRFQVECDREDWVGSDGKNTTLWCELLSPWVLRKELLNIIFHDGLQELLDRSFWCSTVQRSVVFWNAIVSFRLRGLPFTFFFTNNSIVEAFPLPSTT